MKTIEQKAKAYDEAIERAKKELGACGSQDCEAARLIFRLFPGLRESEDEKIRKALMQNLKERFGTKGNMGEGLDMPDVLAWLEKQGEQTSDKIVEKSRTEKQRILLTETDGSANIDWDCRSLDDVKILLKCGLEFIRTIEANKQILTDNRFGGCPFRVPTRYDKGIKQGSQNLANSTKTCKDEQKPADKVEPKFKVGDWIINTESGYIRQILKINNGCYETDYGVLPIKDYESLFRLWTIQNAKEGEVLALFYASQNYILIYKGLYEKSFKTIMSVFCFYCVEEDKYYDETDSFHVMNRGEIITPATKEQRDTLMKAMTDAGYTFDFEKKELKRIVTPKFNVHDCIIKKHNSNINDFGSFIITDITGGKYWYNDRIVCDILEQDEWELYEPVRQNTAKWSKEDEQYLLVCKNALQKYEKTDQWDADIIFTWLKSLKYRVGCEANCTTTNEWSEEDEKIYQSIMDDTVQENQLDSKQIDWLRNIKYRNFARPQTKWKPSDRELGAILTAVGDERQKGSDVAKELLNIYQQLKKLKG